MFKMRYKLTTTDKGNIYDRFSDAKVFNTLKGALNQALKKTKKYVNENYHEGFDMKKYSVRSMGVDDRIRSNILMIYYMDNFMFYIFIYVD